MALQRTVRWVPLEGQGLEHLDLREDALGIAASGAVIGEIDGTAYGACYTVRLAPDWTCRSVSVSRTDGVTLSLAADGRGHWQDDAGPRPDLAGCVDIDLSGSPFTNSLPIRRVPMAVGVPTRFRMAFVHLGRVEAFVDEQVYTRLDAAGRRYRFAAADGSFSAELSVDGDGLVVDYPPLFRRA